MEARCKNCTEKCPQAEMAHQAALGRMYATKEFTELLKKVESGELVEVVRCKDCIHRVIGTWAKCTGRKPDDFCSDGVGRYHD